MGLVFVALISACQPRDGDNDGIVTADDAQIFDAIAPDETVYFSGTEPFWGGQAVYGTLTYMTPDNGDGVDIEVERFVGNNGLSFSGEMNGQAFDLAVTPGECSDAMSDRTYPYVATLQIDEEARAGCAWTDLQPFSGPQNP